MGGRTGGRKDGRTGGRKDGWTEGRVDGRTEGRVGRREENNNWRMDGLSQGRKGGDKEVAPKRRAAITSSTDFNYLLHDARSLSCHWSLPAEVVSLEVSTFRAAHARSCESPRWRMILFRFPCPNPRVASSAAANAACSNYHVASH
ncbi:hypothetical protein LSAT2_008428 [Lamellibrachia satsuma]|nr:hypothetical protein LSAT2_008428 [Lamellibrachia satsuma]